MSTPAATKRQVRPVPEGYHAVTPYLCVKGGAAAIEFYRRAFGATETLRLPMPDGRVGHAEMRIGDSLIMLSDEFPEYGARSPESIGGSPVTIHLFVEDVDAVAAQAVAAGARILTPAKDQFYGDRSGRLADPFGHVWIVSTHIEDVSPEEMVRRTEAFMKQEGAGAADHEAAATTPRVKPVREGFHTVTPYLLVPDPAGLLEFCQRAFGATETYRGTGSAGGMHAELRIGDSMIMLGGYQGMQEKPMAIHLYVDDADAVYRRALEAGATSIHELVNQDHGDREGSVKDAAGNYWYIATHQLTGKPIPEGMHSVTPYLHARGTAQLIDFLKQALGAEEAARYQSPDGTIVHARVRIGDSMIEMGEAHGPYPPMPAMLYLYVDDVDALYARAVQAGAKSVAPPADQPYGDRNAHVEDSFGNVWYIATHIRDLPA